MPRRGRVRLADMDWHIWVVLGCGFAVACLYLWGWWDAQQELRRFRRAEEMARERLRRAWEDRADLTDGEAQTGDSSEGER